MGKNKLQKFLENKEFAHLIQPEGDYFSRDHELKGAWAERIFGRQAPIVLEMGCGKGEYTTQMAGLFPEKNFIGIDIKGARLWRGAKEVASRGLSNAVFLRIRAEAITSFFDQTDGVEEVWCTFPDPQPKKPGKRLIAPPYLARYSSFLPNAATIHLKSDNQELYRFAKATAQRNHLPIAQDFPNLYETCLSDPLLSIQTFYEQRWRSEGRPIAFLSFRLFHKDSYSFPLREAD